MTPRSRTNMRQLLVREQCLQREQKLAHSSKQQLPAASASIRHETSSSSSSEMGTATIAITPGVCRLPHSGQWPSSIAAASRMPLPQSTHPKASRPFKCKLALLYIDGFVLQLQLKNPTRYHVLQSQKRRLTSEQSWQQQQKDKDCEEAAESNPDVGHKHLLCPPKTVFMPRSAPEEALPRDEDEFYYGVEGCLSAPESNQVPEYLQPAEPAEDASRTKVGTIFADP